MLHLIIAHPFEAVLLALLLSQSASALPTPTVTGRLSSPLYAWFFGTVHIFVAIPRIVITFFPQYAWIFGHNAANKDLQASDKTALQVEKP